MSGLAHWDEVPWRERTVGEIGSSRQDLGSAAGTVTAGLRRWRIRPGMRSTPPHAHGAEEEIFFVLDGSGLLWQDGATCKVREGDCIVHLADAEAHTLRAGPSGMEVLAFGQRVYSENTHHPHSGLVGAGVTAARAEGDVDLFEADAAAGPLGFPQPGPRPGNVVAFDDVEEHHYAQADTESRSRGLSHAAGSARSGLGHDVVPPGKLGTVPHCHSAEEEIFVVLEGDGHALLGDEEVPLRPGHVLSCPPGDRVPHCIRGGEAGITYLTYGTRDPNDMCWYPRSKKIAFRGLGVLVRVEPVDYWEGEG